MYFSVQFELQYVIIVKPETSSHAVQILVILHERNVSFKLI